LVYITRNSSFTPVVILRTYQNRVWKEDFFLNGELLCCKMLSKSISSFFLSSSCLPHKEESQFFHAFTLNREPKNALSLPSSASSYSGGGIVAPLSGSNPGVIRAQVSHGVRQVVVCKDAEGKVGLKVKDINKGIFVCLVTKNSPAALAGLRFGDQILQINGQNLAGLSAEKVHSMFKKAGVNNISLAVRDRPFERTITLHKDSTGHIGFQFKEGKITHIGLDTSAARNGLLIDHQLLEVNGQNVVGIKDKEVGAIIEEGGNIITITIIPSFMYNHIMKNMKNSVVKKFMDHSIPDV